MPVSEVHKARKVKNYLIFMITLLIVLTMFSLTLVKLRMNPNDEKGVRIEEYEKVNKIKKDIINDISGSEPAPAEEPAEKGQKQ